MRNIIYTIFFLLSFFQAGAVELFFNHLSIDEGLSSNFVKTTYVDGYGYVWLGSFGGVDRYDGDLVKSFNRYFPDDVSSVNCFTEDSVGNLWIGTERGLYFWDRISTHFSSFSIVDSPIINISKIQCSDQNVLYLSSDLGFFSIDIETEEVRSIPFHEDRKHVLNYTTDFLLEGNKIFISTEGGLVQYNTLLKSALILNSVLKNDSINGGFTCISKKDDDIYLGRRSRGLVKLSMHTMQFTDFDEFKEDKILSIIYYQNNLLIGTDTKGLKVFDLQHKTMKRFVHLADDNHSISSNTIISILKDANDILWLGTYEGGLSYTSIKETIFKTYRPSQIDLLANQSIRSVYMDKNGRKILGTREGLYVIDKFENAQYFNHKNSKLKAKTILTLHEFDNKVLIGTYEGGIYSYSFESNKLEPWMNDSFNHHSIFSLNNDSNDNLWIAGLEGVYMLNNLNRIKHFDFKSNNSLDHVVYDLEVDREDRIWIGGNNGATVNEYIDDELRFLKTLPFESGVRVVTFYLDSENKMWVGTVKHGVFIFDSQLNLLQNITEDKGLCHNSVTSVIETSPNEFCISTLSGLTFYNALKDSCFNFYSAQGIPGPTFCRGASFAGLQGDIWLGNEKGLVYFRPDELKYVEANNKLYISDIYLGGKPINEELVDLVETPVENIQFFELPNAYNSVGFRFVNLNFLSPGNFDYAVMLGGRDSTWSILKNDNTVFYNALKPGKYVFKVGLSNSAGVVDQSGVKLIEFSIKLAWYKMYPIIFLVFVLVFFMTFIMMNRSVNKKVENAKEITNKEKYEFSKLDRDKSKKMLVKIQEYMERSQVYLNQDLKLGDLSAELDISVHHISQAINENLNYGFTYFVNSYRVNEVIKRLETPEFDKFTLKAIAESCGFKSKSTFNRFFKLVTGITPTEYLIKNNLKGR